MRKLIVLCFSVSFVLLVLGISDFAEPQNLDSPLPGRIRAGYMSASNISLLPRMSQVGMNAALPKFNISTSLLSIDSIAALRQWAGQCARLGLLFMPVFNWWDATQGQNLTNYNHVVTDSGAVLANTPCPYNQSFWDNWVTPRLLSLIQAVADLPLNAVLIDMEMYNVESTEYNRGCYCDQCYTRYMKAKGLSGPLPAPAARNGIVNSAGDLAFYESLQREAVHSYATALRQAAQKLYPGLRLGALQLDSTIPLQQGIALGFGTPALPVYCLTERTYETGYTPYIASTKNSFSNLGAYVDLLVGIWQSRFPTANIPEQLYYSAHDSHGYWIYTMETFANPDYQPLPGTLDQGWSAIQAADQELDKLAANPNYLTALQIRPIAPPPLPLDWSGFVNLNLLPSSSSKKAPNPMPVARLRETNWYYFYAVKGDNIEFELTWRQVGNYTDPVRGGMISPAGIKLADGSSTNGSPFSIKTVAAETGVYGLVTMAGGGNANGVDITRASHPYVIYTGSKSGALFYSVVPPLYVSVIPNVTQVDLQFSTQNTAESVKGTVLAKDGSQLWSGVVNGPTQVLINNPGASPLQIRFDQILGFNLGAIWVKTVNGVMPFVASDPSALLTAVKPAFLFLKGP
jgi:hypothetical protein